MTTSSKSDNTAQAALLRARCEDGATPAFVPDTADMTEQEEERILAQAKAIEERRMERWRGQAERVEHRIRSGHTPFKDEELIYAASALCKCGAGFAYPNHIGPNGAWYCSRWLKTREDAMDMHSPSMPFSFWSVRSETQIARNGGLVTTRPAGAPWGDYMERAVQRENERSAQYEPGKPAIDLKTAHVVRHGT